MTRNAVLALLIANAVGSASARAIQTEDPLPRAREVVTWLAAKEHTKVHALFSPEMLAAMPEARLRGVWDGTIAAVGAFKQQVSARADTKGAYRIAVVTCEFERGNLDIQIVFDAAGKIAGLQLRPAASSVAYAPPPYVTPSAYTEIEVTVGANGWPLPGTLAIPVGQGPFPAVVLVHGSGPHDRDQTFGPNKPFKDLALGLASRGVAVLRYEKRSKQHPARLSKLSPMTVKEEAIDDTVAAVAWLRKAPRIDPKRVFVLGHSLGGMLVPRIAATDNALAGLVVMAGAARSLEQAIVEQTRYMAMADEKLSEEEEQQIKGVEELAKSVRGLTAADAAAGTLIAGAPASYWLDLRGYDPPSAAKAIAQPLLVLQGERDYQVTMAEFAAWRKALSGRTNVTLRSYPALNHLFIAGTGASLPAEYLKPAHVDAAVVQDIAEWVGKVR
jgi:dienelactone hydrolase